MGLLNSTQQAYYQGNDFGNYQFVSLKDIINQFMLVYVGEDKIITKAKRMDVAFHAQRALAELSFDTFKSCKAQEITVPATLQMKLPHDYVNYTKISWSDSAGIKRPLYPTSNTSNPFSIQQDSLGNYEFLPNAPLLVNPDFDDPLQDPWFTSSPYAHGIYQGYSKNKLDDISVISGALTFTQYTHSTWTKSKSYIYTAYQQVDVTNIDAIELSAKGTTQGVATGILGGTLKVGLLASQPDSSVTYYPDSPVVSSNVDPTWLQTLNGNDARLEWLVGQSGVTDSLVDNNGIDVSAYDTVWLMITSVIDFVQSSPAALATENPGVNSIDDISLTNTETLEQLQTNATSTSTTWSNYKSGGSSEVDHQTSHHHHNDHETLNKRYGLDPQHAQVNGSFYIDCVSGKIHFSSNISGKTVILDYISDSLGTDGEMQVHKFAEEAMYKWISHAILAGKANIPEYQVNRFKKERFAAIRTAKLRLSNLKLEELTQVLRGKSKQIKH